MYRVCAQLFQLNTFVLVPFLRIIPKPITISIDIQKKKHTQRSARVHFSYFYFTFRFSSIVWMIREGEKSIFTERRFSYNRRCQHISHITTDILLFWCFHTVLLVSLAFFWLSFFCSRSMLFLHFVRLLIIYFIFLCRLPFYFGEHFVCGNRKNKCTVCVFT